MNNFFILIISCVLFTEAKASTIGLHPPDSDTKYDHTYQLDQSKTATVTVTVTGINKNNLQFEIGVHHPDQDPIYIPLQLKKTSKTKELRFKIFQGNFVDKEFNQILRGQTKKHFSRTDVTGFQVGRVIYNNFKGWPINIVAVLGMALHDDKNYQGKYPSYTAMLKGEWKAFPWNKYVRTKLELSEGINYTEEVPHFESIETRKKNNGRDSKLLNFIGFGITFNIDDILHIKNLENCYIGPHVYHRSGVFGFVPQFNNIRGGSNYVGAAIECGY